MIPEYRVGPEGVGIVASLPPALPVQLPGEDGGRPRRRLLAPVQVAGEGRGLGVVAVPGPAHRHPLQGVQQVDVPGVGVALPPLHVVPPAARPDGVEGGGVSTVDNVVLRQVVRSTVVLEGVGARPAQDVVLECDAAGAGVAVQGAGTYVIRRAVLDPVVVDVGVGVAASPLLEG